MSVTCVLHEASDEEITDLLQSPEKIHPFIRWDPPKKSWSIDFLGRKTIRTHGSELPFLDLGRSWEAIHFVLTGKKTKISSPLSFLLSGGRYIGDEDVGYGPARALTSNLVKKVSSALEGISPEDFAVRIDVQKMEPFHFNGAPFPGDNEGLRFFIMDYTELREYIIKLSGRNLGVIIQYV